MRLLAAGNSLNVVVSTVSKEFGCSESAIYRDYANISQWAGEFNQDKQAVSVLRVRLETLFRDSVEARNEAGEKNLCAKIGAINSALKITKEQIKLAAILGLLESKPVEVAQSFPTSMPFEALPEIKEAFRRAAEAQKAENAQKAEKAKKDAKDQEETSESAAGS